MWFRKPLLYPLCEKPSAFAHDARGGKKILRSAAKVVIRACNSGRIVRSPAGVPDFTRLGLGLSLDSDAVVDDYGSVIGDPTEAALGWC
jgi:hypothetical protein